MATAQAKPRLRIPLAAYYRQRMKVDLATMFAYRGAVMIWFFGLVISPLVSLMVWRSVANSSSDPGGMNAGDYSAYFIALLIVNSLTFMWQMWQIEWRVRSGHYSPILLRPLHPIHEDIPGNISFKVLTLVPLVPIVLALSMLFDPNFNTSALDVISSIPAILLAFLLRFTVEWCVGLTAFWFTRASSIYALYWSISFLLTGNVAPLSLLPEWARVIATILPFRWMIYFPIQVLLGNLSLGEILTGLAVQVSWLAIAILAVRVGWIRAANRYSAVGG
jgi:ABC-2 type transport system permease protein